MKLSGTVFNRQGFDDRDRVFAVSEGGSILGEARVPKDGRWSLQVAQAPTWIVIQLSGSRLAAVATRPAASGRIDMPDLVRLRVSFESTVQGAVFWADPVELEGFPQDVLWALRTHPKGVVDLHMGEFPVMETGLQLKVQRGKYRLSGGRIAIRPTVGEEGGTIVLAQAIDDITGMTFEAAHGEVVVNVHDDVSYRLSFAPID